MTKREKVKNFVIDHHVEIMLALGLISGISIGIGVNESVHDRQRKKFMKDTTVFNIPDLRVSDFGKVGEEVISTIDEVTKDTPVKGWMIDYKL